MLNMMATSTLAFALCIPCGFASTPRIYNCTLNARVVPAGDLKSKALPLSESQLDGRISNYPVTMVQNDGLTYIVKGNQVAAINHELKFTLFKSVLLAGITVDWLIAPNPVGNGLEIIQLSHVSPRKLDLSYHSIKAHVQEEPQGLFQADYSYIGNCE